MGIKEQIYLLEIHVQDVHLESVKELEVLEEREIKIYAHFLSFEPVIIYDHLDEEFKALPILFKMSPNELIRALDRSPLTLSVAGMLDDKREYTVGTVKILFNESFPEAITLATTSIMYPVTSQLEESFPFRNLYHEDSGEIFVSIKLSCFGYIDMKQLGPCELQDQYKHSIDEIDKNIPPDDLDVDGDMKPIIADLDYYQPTKTTDKPEGVPQNIAWKMAPETQFQKTEPVVHQTHEKSKVTAEIRDANKNEITLQCTCEAVPEFMIHKPLPPQITLRCECADILAAMKGVFPATQEPMIAAPQMQPMLVPVPSMTQLRPQGAIGAPSVEISPAGIISPAAPSPPTVTEIVPTTAVCGLDLKQNNPSVAIRGNSEEKVQQPVNKQEIVKKNISSVEVSPEAKTEDSMKKLREDKEGSNWDERKQVIKKEYKKKNKKVREIYEYTAGMYPGMVIGHKYCIPSIRMVPRNMGWMWNLLDLFGSAKKSKGWRPGAMLKSVANNFGSWNKAAGFKDGDDVETFFNFKRKKGAKEAEQQKELHPIKPTLHVHKKDKFYHITVSPPGQSNVKPLTFKVDPRKGSSDEETSSESTSDDSFEFEYTVPAGLIPPSPKIEWANETTQYNIQDFSPKKKQDVQGAAPEEQPKGQERKDSKGKGGKGKGGKGGKGKKK